MHAVHARWRILAALVIGCGGTPVTGPDSGGGGGPVEAPTAQCPWSVLGGPIDVDGLYGAASVALAIEPTTGRPVMAMAVHTDSDHFRSAVYVRRWDGTQWVALGDALEAMPHANARNPQIAAGPDGIVVTWSENDPVQNGPDAVYARRWDDAQRAWVALGGALNHDTTGYLRYPAIAIDATGAPVIAWEEPFTTPWAGHAINVARWDGNAWVALDTHAIMSEDLVGWPSLHRDPTTGDLVVGTLDDNGASSNFQGDLIVDRWAGSTSWLGDYKSIPGFATRLAMAVTTDTIYAALEANTFAPFEGSIWRWDAALHDWRALPEFPSGDPMIDPAIVADGTAIVVSAVTTVVVDVKRWRDGQWTSLCDNVIAADALYGPGRTHALAIDSSGLVTFAHLAESGRGHFAVVVRQGSAR